MANENKTFREVYGIADNHIVPVEQTDEEYFNAVCERYRTMRKSIEGKPFEEQREVINNFRAGRFKL